MRQPVLLGTLAALLATALASTSASAHGFGDRYDLPVPLSAYLGGAGAAVVFSFVVIGVFVRGPRGLKTPRFNLLRWRAGRALAHPVVLETVRAISVALFAAYLVGGLFGNQDPDENLVPTMTWIVFWVGIAYVSAFVGNIWALINPWKVLFGYAERAYDRLVGGSLSLHEPYPERLGAWPAVVLFFLFAWIEVAYPDSGVPRNVTVLVLGYTAITFAGMWWFGRDVWLKNGEAFSIALSYLAAFSPTEVRVRARDGVAGEANDYEAYAEAPAGQRECNLRPWGAGLLSGGMPTLSHAVLLLLMLSSVTFDGFAETPEWTRILIRWQSSFSFLGLHAFTGITTVGLIVAPFLFFGVFAVTAKVMGLLARSSLSIAELVRVFALSLVPIALAYHVAHFFSFLVIQGQRIPALASDPFGWGWDLFGTAGVSIDVGVVNARFVWALSVAAIVIGHVVAVYVAHVYAMRTFPTNAAAVRSQYPMLFLMVGYTMVSLWIVAQPIVLTG